MCGSRGYATADTVANPRTIGVTPHVTQHNAVSKTGRIRNSAIEERTTRHQGYGMSQSRRAMVECIFGWGKQHGTMCKTKHRGIARVATDLLPTRLGSRGVAVSVPFRHAAPPHQPRVFPWHPRSLRSPLASVHGRALCGRVAVVPQWRISLHAAGEVPRVGTRTGRQGAGHNDR